MDDVTADSAQKAANQRAAWKTSSRLCYGQIGISAVAAAVRYQGDAKNPAYTPVAMKTDDRGTTVA